MNQALGKPSQIGIKSGPVFPLNPWYKIHEIEFLSGLILKRDEVLAKSWGLV
jgi:hypothetical protein